MATTFTKKLIWVLFALVLLWCALRYVLPMALPFLVGGALAWGAEPLVALCAGKCRMPRALAAGLGICGVLTALLTILSLVGAVVVRQLGALVGALPDLQQTAREGVQTAQTFLLRFADSTPQGVRPFLTNTVERFFRDGTAVMDQVADQIPGVVTKVLGAVPAGALGVGTAILAAFMISARLPQLREKAAGLLPEKWRERYLPMFRQLRHILGGWLKAQGILCLVTYGIITLGFLFLKVPFAPVWAALVALVDAVPLLGTGTVLVPCALISCMQGQFFRGLLYLLLYGLSAGARAVLEPKLVGKNLGLDPLVTLFAIYVGYRFFGFLGLILAPMAAAVIAQLVNGVKV